MNPRPVDRKSTEVTIQGLSVSTACETPVLILNRDSAHGFVPRYFLTKTQRGEKQNLHEKGCSNEASPVQQQSDFLELTSDNRQKENFSIVNKLSSIAPHTLTDLDEQDACMDAKCLESGGSLATNLSLLMGKHSQTPRLKLALKVKETAVGIDKSSIPPPKQALKLNCITNPRYTTSNSRPSLKINLGQFGIISCKPSGDQGGMPDDWLEGPDNPISPPKSKKAREGSSSPESSSRQTFQIHRLGSNNLSKAKRKAFEFEIHRMSGRSGGFDRTSLRLTQRQEPTEDFPSWAAQTLELSNNTPSCKKPSSVRRKQSMSRKSNNSGMLQNEEVSLAESQAPAGLGLLPRSALGVHEHMMRPGPSTMTLEFPPERVPSFNFAQTEHISELDYERSCQLDQVQALGPTDTLSGIQESKPQPSSNKPNLDTNIDLDALVRPFIATALRAQTAYKS